MNQVSNRVKVMAFDVFGTVVDWHGSVKREVEELGLDVDAAEFARAWRAGYKPAMAGVMERGEWVILDDLHRRILDRVLADYGLDSMTDSGRRHLNLAWHRLDPWPDSVEGLTRLKSKYIVCSLSNGNIGLLTGMAKTQTCPGQKSCWAPAASRAPIRETRALSSTPGLVGRGSTWLPG